MRLSFASNNVFVNEEDGTVPVCLVKSDRTARNIIFDVTASEINDEAECKLNNLLFL